MSASGFTLLINRHVFIRRREEYLHIAGVDDVLHGKPDLVKALHGLKENDPTLLLAHEPDFADAAARYKNVVLQLSGHSHGGQIRLPFIGHLVVPPMARKYVMGLYEVGASNMLLYTNRGIGTTSFPVRLNCRP